MVKRSMKIIVEVEEVIYKEMGKLINGGICEVVEELEKEYKLDIEEVKKKVKVEVVKRCEKKDVKIVLPYTGEIIEGRCHGIKANYGLYSQCMNLKEKNGYCLTCYKQSIKNENGKPNHGNILERGMDYKDKNGKIPVKYSVVMKKQNLTREMVENEAQKVGVRIPEEEFETQKTQRGRPKKSTDNTEKKEHKPRGRPRKEKKVIENGNEGDDLIESLVKQAKNINEKNDDEMESDKKKETEIKENEKESDDEVDDEDDDEEETAVVVFKIKGKKYLKAADNTLYDFDSHEVIGVWNEKTQNIDPEDED